MKKASILIGLLVLAGAPLKAQTQGFVEDYDWVNAPKLSVLTESEQQESQVYILDRQITEYKYDEAFMLYEYKLVHRLVHLNDDDAVDNFNKVSFPPASYVDFVSRKARVIKKNGEVIYLNDKDILTYSDPEEGDYDYFALEGIEVGDEVEYLYGYKTFPRSITGRQIVLQSQHAPKRSCTYSVVSPSNLVFVARSYNGFPELVQDSTKEDVNYLTATWTDMPKFKEEKYAPAEANMAYVIHRMSENLFSGSQIDPYPELANNIANILGEVNPAKVKIKKLIKAAEMEDLHTTEDRIRAAEKFIKENITMTSSGDDVKTVIKKREGSRAGILKTYAALCRYYDIDFEVVYTTARSDFKFDPDFDCNIFLQSEMIYFPKIDQYLAPFSITSSLGLPPSDYTANYGLFVKFIDLNGTFSGYSKVKMIEALPADVSVDKMDIEASFEELPVTRVKLDRELSGYNASTNQVIYEYLNEDSRKEIREGLVNYIDEDMEITELDVDNLGSEFVNRKPIVVKAEFESEKFIGKAGNNYLINVGELIGPQDQLYNESERQYGVENQYNRMYKRTIVLTIPEGYSATNLDALNMNIVYSPSGHTDSTSADSDENSESDMGFISTYKVDGNKITINVTEYYRSIYYDLSRYKEFENVINAAADFNKITLLLEKS